jgi:2-polyprenyl-3-methyl-5-hydroxy-6-metoxy-1,4-benzoquinol methylase
MKHIFEHIYREPNNAPWTLGTPFIKLVEAVENGTIKPCRALDLGCGEGYDSKFLAEHGFDVVGVDLSERAIGYAKKNTPTVDFRALDIIEDDLSGLGKFDFAFERGVIHCLPFDQKKAYVQRVASLLNPNATFMEVTFSINSAKGGNPGEKVRNTNKCFPLYLSTLEELKEMYSNYFEVLDAHEDFYMGEYQGNLLLLKRK